MKTLRLLLFLSVCSVCSVGHLRAQRLLDNLTLGGTNYLKNAATFTVQSGATLTIASGGALTVASGATFTAPAGIFEVPLTFSTPLSRATNTISIGNAAADGSTKGAAAFNANDFNASSGVISLDYTNGQAASGSNKGFLTTTDWSTFNGKLTPPGTPATGDIIYYNGSAWVSLARGADGKVLKSTSTTINWDTDLNGGGGGGTSIATSTSTGTQNDFSFSSATTLRMNNATATTITGLAAGSAGQVLTIVSVGAGAVKLTNQDTGSSAANRIINTVTGPLWLSAGSGSVALVYDDTTQRWRVVSHEQGAPIAIAHSGGNYTATSGTWTVASGDQEVLNYTLKGRLLTICGVLNSTSLSSTPGNTVLDLSGLGYTWVSYFYLPFAYSDNGTYGTGLVVPNAVGGNTVLFFKNIAGTAWAASTDNTSMRFALTIPVQ